VGGAEEVRGDGLARDLLNALFGPQVEAGRGAFVTAVDEVKVFAAADAVSFSQPCGRSR
jgi:hypothetical protein